MHLSENKYIASILKVLDKQKEIAFQEFSNSDLNGQEQINEINTWTQMLTKLIYKNPPIYHVRCLFIYEDEDGEVIRIDYDYYKEHEMKKSPSVIIKTNLFD